MKPKISICIPTYNRAQHLSNCLNSILLNRGFPEQDIQVCISDNCSTDDTENVVLGYQDSIDIKYHKNDENLGIPRNFLNVVEMADAEFVWLIGDDDLLVPHAFRDLLALIKNNINVDFFYINAFHLTTEYVFQQALPFNTKHLPENMEPFTRFSSDGVMRFFDLIDPSVSFDFLGGMFLAVFRRQKWLNNAGVLDDTAIHDVRTFSHFDNTFPHVKIFAKAFFESNAYFSSTPLCVCLTGAREWAPMYPFVRSVRLVEALDEYRKNGLPYWQYLKCKNFALNTFIPDFVYTFLNKDVSGYEYVNPLALMLKNFAFPGFYWSFFKYCIRKFKEKLAAD